MFERKDYKSCLLCYYNFAFLYCHNLRMMKPATKLQSKLALFETKLSEQLKIQLNCARENSLKKFNYVLAKHRNANIWLKSRIVTHRLSKDYVCKSPKSAASYDYYVHFINQDKRNDCWLTYSQIKETEEKIPQDSQQILDFTNLHPYDNPHYGLSPAEIEIHLKLTKYKTIQKIMMGKYLADTWYFSPYPPYYQNLQVLYICQYCLSFYAKDSELKRHDQQCPLFHPPGDQIYRDQELKLSIFEVDGEKNATYCQNLGYLSKLFLDHKNLLHDMSIFFFYVLCQIIDDVFHIVGYFSKVNDFFIKVKQSPNNLSCILIFPFHQKKGYGKFLINFSYQLSLVQCKTGTPQKPFSDLGREAYLSYWTQIIVELLLKNPKKYSQISEISMKTSFTQEDIKWVLEKRKLIKIVGNEVNLCCEKKTLKELQKQCGRPTIKINREALHYVPWRKWQFKQDSSSKSEQSNI